jgi:multicomponent Na+:H+ antiporter subunit E
MVDARQPASLGRRLRAGIATGAVLAGIWWLLNPGDHASWLVGGPTVALGAVLAALLPRPAAHQLSVFGAIRFAAFFLWQSVLGAVDVALRALDPRLPIDPGLRRVEIDLPPGPPMTLFANTVTLLPGTLTAEIDGNRLIVHALDQAADPEAELNCLARRVRDLFGLPEKGGPR